MSVVALWLGAACATREPASAAPVAAFHYTLAWDAGARMVRGELRATMPVATPLAFDDIGERFAHGPASAGPLMEGSASAWSFELASAAAALDDIDRLAARGHGITGSLALLLPIPSAADDDASFTLHVQPAPGEHFACACAPVAADRWRGTLGQLQIGRAHV